MKDLKESLKEEENELKEEENESLKKDNLKENQEKENNQSAEKKESLEKEILTFENEEILWRAAERVFYEKNLNWYLIVIFFSLILFIYSLLKKNFLFAVFIILVTWVIIDLNRRRPRVIEFKINQEGIYLDKDIFYPFTDLESFGIFSKPEQLPQIVIKKKKGFFPLIYLPIDNQLLPKAKELLGKKINFVEYQPSFSDFLNDFFNI